MLVFLCFLFNYRSKTLLIIGLPRYMIGGKLICSATPLYDRLQSYLLGLPGNMIGANSIC